MPELLDVAPREITPHPKNPRHAVGDVADLADSIRSVGLLEPLVVAPQVEGGKGTYRLIAGHRRLAAAKVAKVKTVPVILRVDLDTEPRQLEAALVENLHRTDLTPVEEGEGYQLLLEFPGYTQAKIAKATGRSPATVRDRLKLTKLPPKIRERIHTGQISLTEATSIAEFADDAQAMKKLESAAGTSNFTWYLQQARQSRKDERDAARARKELEAAGVRIVPDPGVSYTGDAAGPRRLNAYGGPQIDEEEHAKTCEHHAAAEPTNGSIRYVCLDPSVHEEIVGSGAAASPADKAAMKAERERNQQMIDDTRTAQGVRWTFITQATSRGSKAPAVTEYLVRLLVDGILEPDEELWSRFLGAGDETSSDYDAATAFIRTRAEAAPATAMLFAATASYLERNLGDHRTWPRLSADECAWLQLLVSDGYEISDFERRHWNTALAAIAESEAKESADASGD